MPRHTPSTRRRVAKLSGMGRAAVAVPTLAARPSQLRTSNKRLLLRMLRAHSPCSRADLVRLSGLTAPTVSMVTAHLIAGGLVEEMGEGTSSGGRRPSMLRFNGQYGYVAAVDIGGTRLRMMLADLNGKPVSECDLRMRDQQKTPRGIVSLIREGVERMAVEAGAHGRVMHVTAGAPGITDVRRGVVLAAPNLCGWNDVPLRSMLERELSISAEVENDTNLAALGEHAEGVARGADNFVFIAMGTGVGAGIFLRGALHQGANWSAGEMGYLPVISEPRQRVQMRETGQLERLIGGLGIEERWQAALRKERRGAREELAKLRAPQIFDLADRGDERAAKVLDFTARILADALGTVSLLYNPELLVLGGGVGSHAGLCTRTTHYLQESDFPLPALRSSSLGTQAQLYGAVSVSIAAVEQKLLS